MSARILLLPFTFAIVSYVSACGGHPWHPNPPAGVTYQYDFQGYRSSDTVVVGGTQNGFPAYGGAFAFRDAKGVHEEQGGKDPFSQSVPIDGMRFNGHLEGQGARLLPGGAPPPASAPAPSGSAF